jgi:hypothetical protein
LVVPEVTVVVRPPREPTATVVPVVMPAPVGVVATVPTV